MRSRPIDGVMAAATARSDQTLEKAATAFGLRRLVAVVEDAWRRRWRAGWRRTGSMRRTGISGGTILICFGTIFALTDDREIIHVRHAPLLPGKPTNTRRCIRVLPVLRGKKDSKKWRNGLKRWRAQKNRTLAASKKDWIRSILNSVADKQKRLQQLPGRKFADGATVNPKLDSLISGTIARG